MSKTIAINAGSSSLKWQLYQMPEEVVLAKGMIERIGLPGAISTVKYDGKVEEVTTDIPDHEVAVQRLLDDLIKYHIIEQYSEITGVGHRVVAGGERFKSSVRVTPEVIAEIKGLIPLAPLHNPANVAGIEAFYRILPDITSVAVFDTAFHASMPAKAYRYPIPNRYYDEYSVRKYGAHGTSHEYVSKVAAQALGKPYEAVKLITAHIGNGVSLTAIEGGRSVDTSMGLTPLAGVMMGTRSGELDPSVMPYLLDNVKEELDYKKLLDIFNKQSGLLGISESSSDMRDIQANINKGDEKSRLAFDMFIDRIQKYIAQYMVVLNGVDALVFTAGIGENSAIVRKAVLENFSFMGIKLDDSKNQPGVSGEISSADSSVKVLVIPTDEELVIARDVEALR